MDLKILLISFTLIFNGILAVPGLFGETCCPSEGGSMDLPIYFFGKTDPMTKACCGNGGCDMACCFLHGKCGGKFGA